MPRRALIALSLVACTTALGRPARADLAPEEVGRVLRLPDTPSAHWVWVPDRVLRHSVLFDGDSGRMLGKVDSGMQISPKAPLWSRSRNEIYTVDTVYSRGHRGERKDFVVVYDATTLDVTRDIEIPPRSMDTGTGIALVGMLDGGRFIIVLNQSPGASVSIIDVERNLVTAEAQTQGCAGVFPAGPARFGMLCGDGTAIAIDLTGEGELGRIARSPRFFDPVADPVTEKGVRSGSTWWFVSFEGLMHEVDFETDEPTPKAPWPLFSASEAENEWRVGGAQHLAYHRATGRLYAVVHRGGPGSHKDPGPEIWVYDVATKRKLAELDTPNLIAAFIGPQVGFDSGSTTAKVVNFLLPNLGVHSIAVTQDDAPLLFYRHADLGAVGVMDALTGEHLRDIGEAGLSGTLLVVP